MADDKSNTGSADRSRISLSDDYEVRDWSQKFGITPEELKTAVKAVGNQAKDVEVYLRKSKR